MLLETWLNEAELSMNKGNGSNNLNDCDREFGIKINGSMCGPID
jgi:hypothetical protein